MQGIFPTPGSDPSATPRRLDQIERFINSVTKYDAIVELAGRGPSHMEIIGRFTGKKKPSITVGGPFYAYMTDFDRGRFAVGVGKMITNVSTGEEVKVLGCGAWYDIFRHTKAWIKCTIDQDLTVSKAEVETGIAWPIQMIVFNNDDPPVQTEAYVPIGEFLDGDALDGEDGFNVSLTRGGVTEDFHFNQKIQTNLFAALMTIDGKAAIYPLPIAG